MARPLDELETVIRQRAAELTQNASASSTSYTCKLLAGSINTIGGKVIEEAAELIEAATEPGDVGRAHFVYEAGDLLYHLLVLLRRMNVDLSEIETELARRFGVSGLDEKASREK